VPIDVRVVCGTNRDLHAEVANGAFREDLLYRLQVVEIAVPPLRARKGDIVELATHFLAEAAERSGRAAPKTLAPDALELILDYDWPGNVRELEHALEAAAIYAESDEIRAADLPVAEKHWRRKGERAMAETGRTRFPSGTGEHQPGAVTRSGIKQTLEELERERLAAVLLEHGGNKSRAAKVLGLSRGALLRRLKRYGLESEDAPEN
jgi:DNA-binding NtrC family response regulator